MGTTVGWFEVDVGGYDLDTRDPDAADDPYRAFTAALRASTRDVYRRGMLSRLAGDPQDVAATILRAITSSRPRARYPVTPSARILRGIRLALPDRAWDAFLAGQFTRPGPQDG